MVDPLAYMCTNMPEKVLRLPAALLEGQIDVLRIHRHLELPYDIHRALHCFATSVRTLELYDCSMRAIENIVGSGVLLELRKLTIVRCPGAYAAVVVALATRLERIEFVGCGTLSRKWSPQLSTCANNVIRRKNVS